MKYSKNKKGLSAIIATLLIVMLVMVVTVIVWTFVNKTVKEKTEQSSSCFNIFEKVVLNNDYTCYDSSRKSVQFSVGVADIDIDAVVVAISSESGSKSFTITNNVNNIVDLQGYDGSPNIILPAKNSGLTYVALGFNEMPDSIKVAPIVNGNQCEVTDSINNLDTC